MALKRVFAGFYKRYDRKPVFVVRVLKDIDTGESIVVCKDASFAKEDNEHYYLIRYTSFCEQVEVDGVLRDKYVRQTRRTRSAPSVAAEPTMNTSRTSAKTTGWICGDASSSGNGSSTSAYPTARHLRPCVRILRLPGSRSKRCSTTTPISSGNAFPRGCLSAGQRMPCSRIAA